MSPLLVINRIRQAGGSIWSENGDLRVEAPVGLLTPEDRSVLAEFKTDLVPLLSHPIPVDDPVEREAIVWAEAAPAAEIDQALDQALAEWDLIVEADLQVEEPAAELAEDLDQWLDENTVEPVPCHHCGSLEVWEDLVGRLHCAVCNPPLRAQMLRLQVKRLLEKKQKRRPVASTVGVAAGWHNG